MAIKTVNISFPQKTLKEIDSFAQKESLSRSDVLRIGARKYIRDYFDWQTLQNLGVKQAKKLGLETEEDVVNILS